MNKGQRVVVWIAGALILYIAVNLFVLGGLIVCRPLYDVLFPIVGKMEVFLHFSNTILPILVSAGLLIYLFRNR